MSTQNIENMRSTIDQTKSQMRDTAHKLEQRVDDLRDWKSWVRENPAASFGISVGVGLLVGLAAGPVAHGGARVVRSGVDSGMNSIKMTVQSAIAGYISNEVRKRFG